MFPGPQHPGEHGQRGVEVGIKVIAENIPSRVVRHANSCFFTMVAVDDARKPVPVEAFSPVSSEEQRRHAAALVRKQLRQEFASRLDATRSRAGGV